MAGGTGESVLLEDEENMRIAEIVADQSRGRIENIMHVGAATTKRATKLAEHAAKSGVEAICCVPPFFYRQSDEAIVEHYKAVGSAADLPLFVYNLPQSTGVEITPELLLKIQEGVPQLKGLKHSGLTFANVRAFNKMGLSCLIGNSLLMLPGAYHRRDWLCRRPTQRGAGALGRDLERLQCGRPALGGGRSGQGQRSYPSRPAVRPAFRHQSDPK